MRAIDDGDRRPLRTAFEARRSPMFGFPEQGPDLGRCQAARFARCRTISRTRIGIGTTVWVSVLALASVVALALLILSTWHVFSLVSESVIC